MRSGGAIFGEFGARSGKDSAAPTEAIAAVEPELMGDAAVLRSRSSLQRSA